MKKLHLLLISLLILNFAFTQPRQNFPHPEQMHEKKWESIMQQIKLPPEEQAAVKPVFMKYEKDLWGLHSGVRRKMMPDKSKEMSAQDYSELNDNYINMEIKKSMLLRNYHLELKKLLSPETLFNYYKAERMFKRKLLRNMPPPPEMK